MPPGIRALGVRARADHLKLPLTRHAERRCRRPDY
jgi:hypothetical protein